MEMNYMFELTITPALIALYSVAFACVLYLLFGMRRYAAGIVRKAAADTACKPQADVGMPGVSVIVYSNDDAWNLESYLRSILSQNYNGQMEVIVVNDGAAAATEAVVGRLEEEYGNLYMTFTPTASRNLSRKKLAITLGIKAARYEIVLLTEGNCRISSTDWLTSMMRHFAQGKEVVIGYAHITGGEDAEETFGKCIRDFDSLYTSLKYLSWAIAGRLYRGNSFNLAYRRSLFFKNKGFSRSLNLKYGDDDIFLSEIADGENTAVELSADSIVSVVESNPAKAHAEDKRQHDFTRKYIHQSADFFYGLSLWSWWILIGCLVAGGIIGYPGLIPAIVSGVLFLLTAIPLMVTFNKMSRRLRGNRMLWSVPFLLLFEPIYNMWYKAGSGRHRSRNLTSGI
ncbi:MAG: glycosyltransferase [Duncaniella sp.]|nr:glycosyltransferase [Duncaniella sp.]